MNEEIRKAIVLGFRGIQELAATAGRRETRGTYDPESLRRAEACFATALDKVRLAKALVVDEKSTPRSGLSTASFSTSGAADAHHTAAEAPAGERISGRW